MTLLKLVRNKRGMESLQVAGVVGAAGLIVATMVPLIAKAGKGQIAGSIQALTKVKGTGDLKDFAPKEAYESWASSSDFTTTRNDKYDEKYDGDGAFTRTGTLSEAHRKAGGKSIEANASKMGEDDKWK